MQSVSSRIWTRVAVSISYDDNDYTTGTSLDKHYGGPSRKPSNLGCSNFWWSKKKDCYGTYLTDYNELFLLLWIPGEYSSRCLVNSSLTLWQLDWRSTLFFTYVVLILSFNILVSRNPEFVSFFLAFYWSITLLDCYDQSNNASKRYQMKKMDKKRKEKYSNLKTSSKKRIYKKTDWNLGRI